MKKYICIGCKKTPEELDEYAYWNTQSGLEANEYVEKEEGTFNPVNGHFYCTECYDKAGMPLGVAP